MLKIAIQKIKYLRIILLFLIITDYGLRITDYGLFAQDKIIAIVNKDVVTEKDLNDFINFMRMQLMTEYRGEKLENKIQSMKLDLIEKLIEDRLILQEARKNNIQVDESRVKTRVDEIKKHYNSDREFQNTLAKQGLVQADIESKIREQLLTYTIIDIKIKSKVVINPGEVTDFYQQNLEKFKLSQEREFEAITIDNEELARKVFEELKAGQEFQDLVQKYSLITNKLSSKQDGQLREEIEKEVSKMHLGEISTPIKIQDSFYIFKLDNIIPSRQQNLTEVQDNIYTFLFNQKMEETLVKWIDELKKHAYIKIIQD